MTFVGRNHPMPVMASPAQMRKPMKLLPLALLACWVGTPCGVNADDPPSNSSVGSTGNSTATADQQVVLFDGSTLAGWKGRVDLWSLEDGMIVGRTDKDHPIDRNTFLIYAANEFSDFELSLQFKIESGNSGIQYRSTVAIETDFVVQGYQADIDFGNEFAGIMYEEGRRGILALRGESVTIDSDGEKRKKTIGDAKALGQGIHPGQWNDFRIVAKGNHLQHFINGVMTSEVIDDQPEKSASSGVIGLQLHRGDPMTVRFKNIVIRPLR